MHAPFTNSYRRRDSPCAGPTGQAAYHRFYLCLTSRWTSLLKDHPRVRHVSHREPDQLPPIGAEFVQPGLHSLSIGNHLDDLVLKSFWLLGFDREWLNKEQQKPKSSKTDDCDQLRD